MNPRVDLMCLKCRSATQLTRIDGPNYSWACPDKCLEAVDTGVPTDEELADLQGRSPVDMLFSDRLTAIQILTAKVYSPQILIHFIDCHKPGCYLQIYNKFLVPHFDNVVVLDHVLRTSIVRGEESLRNGIPEPKMYGELLRYLREIKSAKIQGYLTKTFGQSSVLG